MHYSYKSTTREAARQAYRYGKSDVLVYKLHRDHGVAARRPGQSLKGLCFLLAIGPPMIAKGKAGYWWSRVAKLAGRIVGSVQQRVWYV